jgi:hypothetical protein
MLARASLDCLFVGLYCQLVPGAFEHLGGNLRRTMDHLLRPMVDGGLPVDLFDEALNELSDTPRALHLRELCDAIVSAGGPTAVRDLYDRYFRAVSTAQVHTTAFSLIRQLDVRHGSTRFRPSRAWTTRSAAHACDTCVGMLADAVSPSDAPTRELFQAYARDHSSRMLPPILFITISTIRGRGRAVARALLMGTRPLVRLRHYAQSDEASMHDRAQREQQVRVILANVGSSWPEHRRQWLINAALDALDQRHSPDEPSRGNEQQNGSR